MRTDTPTAAASEALRTLLVNAADALELLAEAETQDGGDACCVLALVDTDPLAEIDLDQLVADLRALVAQSPR